MAIDGTVPDDAPEDAAQEDFRLELGQVIDGCRASHRAMLDTVASTATFTALPPGNIRPRST